MGGTKPREDFVQAGPVRLHYLTWGQGTKTLVCLHGTGGSAWHWGPLARSLISDGYRVVAFDQRGHGDSDQPDSGYAVEDFTGDLEASLQAVGIERFDLLGASLGSRVALVFAARHPEQVRKLVLVDLSFAMPESEQQGMINGHKQRPDFFPSLEEAVKWSRNQPNRSKWTSELQDELAPKEVKQLADGRWTWRYSRGAAVQSLQGARRDMWSFVGQLEAPTLLIRGAESAVLDPEVADRMKRTIKQCEMVAIENAGHGVPRDNPISFNRTVRQFLLA